MTNEEIEYQISKYEKLIDIGIAIYKYNGRGEFMHNAMFYKYKLKQLRRN